MKNIIKDNRIISDITFARRFKSFLEDVSPNCPAGEEELNYLKSVADKLLKYQIHTCPKDEVKYHENCGDVIKAPHRELLTIEDKAQWYVSNFYETGMEYPIILEAFRSENIKTVEVREGRVIKIPEYKDEL